MLERELAVSLFRVLRVDVAVELVFGCLLNGGRGICQLKVAAGIAANKSECHGGGL